MADPLFVTDTHPLLWYAADQGKKLGRKARAAFDAFERGEGTVYVPAPVLIESWMLAKSGVLKLESSVGKWWRGVQTPGLIAVDLTPDDVLDAADLAWDHSDIYDRLIVAVARRLDLPLITKDGDITDWGGVDVVW